MIASPSVAGEPEPLAPAAVADPTLLALDCAGSACSAALWRRGDVAARRFAVMKHGQAERLLAMTAEVMAEAKLGFAGLDAIAVTIGPGSFTGLRVGLAAARGLGLATARPVLGITSFAAVAAGLPMAERDGRDVLVALDTRREDLFAQQLGLDLRPRARARLAMPGDLVRDLPPGPLLIAGDGAAVLAPLLPAGADIRLAAGSPHADAAHVAAFAARILASGGSGPEGPASTPNPLYLRPPDARRPAGKVPAA